MDGNGFTGARLPQLQALAPLKSLTLVRYGKGDPDETRNKVKALPPKFGGKFVKQGATHEPAT